MDKIEKDVLIEHFTETIGKGMKLVDKERIIKLLRKSKHKAYAIQEISTSRYIRHNKYTTKDIEKTAIWHNKEDAEQELKEKYNIHLFKVVGITV